MIGVGCYNWYQTSTRQTTAMENRIKALERRLEELHIHQEKRLEEIHTEQARNMELILE